jgi:hypothetical protein
MFRTLTILLLLAIAPVAMGLDIVPTFEDGNEERFQWSHLQKAIVLRAIKDWESVIADDKTIHVKFNLAEDRENLWAALWWATGENPTDVSNVDLRPWHPTFTHGVMLNLALPIWFDETPDTDGDANEHWGDALTVIRHELGHMLGHRHGIYFDDYGTPDQTDPWIDMIVDGVFDPDGLAIPMAGDSHTTNGLMCPDLGYGRHGVEQSAEMLYKAYGYARPSETFETASVSDAVVGLLTPTEDDAPTCLTCPGTKLMLWAGGALGLIALVSFACRCRPQ